MHTAFANPYLLLLTLTGLIGLALLWFRARRLRRIALVEFFGGPERVHSGEPKLARLRFVCLALALLLLAIGLAGPQWGRDWEQAVSPGRDLVVVLDRSRSMLAEKPSRIERARTSLIDFASYLKQHGGGHRLALIVFAGQARQICPLTQDYDHFREVVSAIEPDLPDPDLVAPIGAVSGTRIGQALILAVQAHTGSNPGTQDILLLSDGDDPAHDGEWREGALAARSARVPVFAVGLGDPDRAGPIPSARSAEDGARMQYDGRPVLTRLEEAPLREIAELTGGTYEPARGQTPPLGPLYQQWVASRPVREENEDALPVFRQRHLCFLIPAFLLLIATMGVSGFPSGSRFRSRQEISPSGSESRPTSRGSVTRIGERGWRST